MNYATFFLFELQNFAEVNRIYQEFPSQLNATVFVMRLNVTSQKEDFQS
jgi:hypothetical protein